MKENSKGVTFRSVHVDVNMKRDRCTVYILKKIGSARLASCFILSVSCCLLF